MQIFVAIPLVWSEFIKYLHCTFSGHILWFLSLSRYDRLAASDMYIHMEVHVSPSRISRCICMYGNLVTHTAAHLTATASRVRALALRDPVLTHTGADGNYGDNVPSL